MSQPDQPGLNKNPVPSSPPKISPVVVAALQTLLAGRDAGTALGQLLLLEQDVDFTGLSFKGRYLSLEDFITVPPSIQTLDCDNPAVEEINQRFLGEHPRAGKKSHEREFLDASWCQRYLDALFGIDRDYVFAVAIFIRSMLRYGTDYYAKDIPYWDQTHTLRTVNELGVIKVAAALMEKPQWETKVDDEEIVEKWKLEAVEQGLDPTVVNIAIKRARWLRKTRDALTGSVLTHISGVYISDSLLDEHDLSGLKDIVATLEDVPDKLKDWHPGSDGQVLDLLHPSLHPYVRGRTPRYVPEMNFELAKDTSEIERLSIGILKGCGTLPVRHSYASPEAALSSFGEGMPTTDDSARKDTFELAWPRESVPRFSDLIGKSVAYQWLPTDVSISIPTSEPAEFPAVQFLSYINNLHPQSSTEKARMYPILERIFAKFVPMFGRTINRWGDLPRPSFPEPFYEDSTEDDGEEDDDDDDDSEDYEDEEENNEGEQGEGEDVEGEIGAGAEDADKSGDNKADEDGNSSLFEAIPPSAIDETEDEPNPQMYDFKGSAQLQVIIKLANIHLTPDKPDYPGGSWHVEGTDTERICATGIYYYDSENITTSKLSFRVGVHDPDSYEQNRFGRLIRQFGIDPDGAANQFLNSVVTQQGRCICFPNNMQHRVEPFSLDDRTKPGHRKILAFFLIHPHRRVLSTSDVPPQQFEWFASEIKKGESRLTKLPKEVFDLIIEQASTMATEEGYPWPMSWEEALKHRELLMAERGRFAVHANGDTYEREFNFLNIGAMRTQPMSGFPLNPLPTELILIIFRWTVSIPGEYSPPFDSFFSSAQDGLTDRSIQAAEARTLRFNLLCICRAWYPLAKELLFDHLSASTLLKIRVIRGVLQQSSSAVRGRTRCLDVGTRMAFNTSEMVRVLMDVLPLLPNLEILRIEGWFDVSRDRHRDLVTRLRRLSRLKLLQCHYWNPREPGSPSPVTPNYLRLRGLESFAGIWTIGPRVIPSPPVENATLTTLALFFVSGADLPFGGLNLPALRSFAASGLEFEHGGLLHFLDTHGPQITSLSLSYNVRDPSQLDMKILVRCTALEELVCSQLLRSSMTKLPQKYPTIVRFGFTHLLQKAIDFERSKRGYLNDAFHLDRFPNLKMVRLLNIDCQSPPENSNLERVEDLLSPRGTIRFEDAYGRLIPD